MKHTSTTRRPALTCGVALALCLCLSAGAMDRPAPAQSAKDSTPTSATAVVGQPAPDFALKDLTGKTRSLKEGRGRPVVLEWINVDCPFVQNQYERTGNLPALQREARQGGALWLTLCSSAPGKQGHYSAKEQGKRLQTAGWAGDACLLDGDGKVGRSYGAKTTPHLFVINAEGVLVYDGAIDSVPGTTPESVKKAENHVRPVLQALFEGRAVTPRATKPYGCSVKY